MAWKDSMFDFLFRLVPTMNLWTAYISIKVCYFYSASCAMMEQDYSEFNTLLTVGDIHLVHMHVLNLVLSVPYTSVRDILRYFCDKVINFKPYEKYKKTLASSWGRSCTWEQVPWQTKLPIFLIMTIK